MSIIIYISRNHSHHAKYSGYDQLLKYSSEGSHKVYSSSFEKFPYTLAKLMSKYIGPELYNSESFRKELAAFWLHMKGGGNYIHYLYGDRDFSLLGHFASTKLVLSATFHVPADALWDRFQKLNSIERLNIAIAVSNCQIEVLKELKAQNVVYIPHGIDTEFWFPSAVKVDKMRALSVGVHMRDFEKQVYYAEMIKKLFPEFILDIVVPKAFVSKIPQSPAVRIFSNLSDDELRFKYSSAAFQLLALKDCTANNALLEGLACGLPAIATNVGGVKDYVNDKCGFLCKSDDEFLDSAALLLTDSTLNQSLRVGARNHSLIFDWRKITPLLERYLLQNQQLLMGI